LQYAYQCIAWDFYDTMLSNNVPNLVARLLCCVYDTDHGTLTPVENPEIKTDDTLIGIIEH